MSESEHDPVDELVETIADEVQMDPDGLVQTVGGVTGLQLDDLDPEDAEDALAAWEQRDAERFARIAGTYDGVEDQAVEGFVADVFEEIDGGGNSPSGSDSPAPSQNGRGATDAGGGVSRAEVQQMVEESTPSADEIAASLKQQVDTGGGGGGGQPSDAGQQNQMAQLISQLALKELGHGGGGGLGEQIQEQATQRFVAKAFTPDPGEIMGRMMAMQQYRKMAEDMGMDIDEGMFKDQMESMFDSPTLIDDDEDDG